jgi:hypothetical protein
LRIFSPLQEGCERDNDETFPETSQVASKRKTSRGEPLLYVDAGASPPLQQASLAIDVSVRPPFDVALLLAVGVALV